MVIGAHGVIGTTVRLAVVEVSIADEECVQGHTQRMAGTIVLQTDLVVYRS